MKKAIAMTFIFGAGLAAMTSCGGQKKTTTGKPAINTANFDVSVRPADDFYQYACGGWMRNNPLGAEYARFGTFDQLRDDNLDQLKAIVEEMQSGNHEPGTSTYKISTLYKMGLDADKLNSDGAEPVKEQLARIEEITNGRQLTEMIGTLHHQAIFPYFATFVDADEMNSSMNIVQLQQAGLGMSDRDYYLENTPEMDKIRVAYGQYIEKLFTLAGYAPEYAVRAKESVMKIETHIAKSSYTRELLRDSYKNYNNINVADWGKQNGLIDWNIYFTTLGLPTDSDIIVRQKSFYNDLEKSMKGVSLEDHKLYLTYNLLDDAAPYLSDDFVDASFEFHGKTMSGKQEQQPRWKRALSATDSSLAEVLGQVYVEKYFPASSKEKMLEMVHNLQVALGNRIAGLEWMSDETKTKAMEKLDAFHVKIGYPDKWRDYSGLDIREDSYWANVCRSCIFEMDYNFADAGKPVDRERWLMSPQTVNAYYNPTTNEICFPAGILQPPFFNADADDAVNYGAIGVVIGHEMTHGFDDQGRNYDKDGNLNDWWTEEDAEKFTKLADILVKQFDDIIVADDVHANGSYTLGENIADQGGLLVSYEGYKNSLEGKAEPEPIDGLTDDQRFYVGYATLWAQNVRREEILRLTKIDVHSLGQWRVDATLKNVDDFYRAFDVEEGDGMWLAPENRVVIW